jgi:hypothetical protein
VALPSEFVRAQPVEAIERIANQNARAWLKLTDESVLDP